jgi:hypothetical protein
MENTVLVSKEINTRVCPGSGLARLLLALPLCERRANITQAHRAELLEFSGYVFRMLTNETLVMSSVASNINYIFATAGRAKCPVCDVQQHHIRTSRRYTLRATNRKPDTESIPYVRPIGSQTLRVYPTCDQQEARHWEYTLRATNRKPDTESIPYVQLIGSQTLRVYPTCDQ